MTPLTLLSFTGPRTAREVWDAAEREGLSASTVRAASEELSIRRQMIPGQGPTATYWLLPGQELATEVSRSPKLDAIFHQLEEQWPPRSPLDEEETEHPQSTNLPSSSRRDG